MNDWKQRNPTADRQLWNEPRRNRGRALVWGIGMPLAVGMLVLAGLAASRPHFRLTMLFAQNAPAAVTEQVTRPAITHVATPAPAKAAEQPVPPKRSNTRHSH